MDTVLQTPFRALVGFNVSLWYFFLGLEPKHCHCHMDIHFQEFDAFRFDAIGSVDVVESWYRIGGCNIYWLFCSEKFS